jgi:hypothetical protein
VLDVPVAVRDLVNPKLAGDLVDVLGVEADPGLFEVPSVSCRSYE